MYNIYIYPVCILCTYSCFFYYDNCYESPSFSDLAAPCSANFIEFLCGHCSETPTPDQKVRLVCYEVNVSTLQPLQYTVYPYIVQKCAVYTCIAYIYIYAYHNRICTVYSIYVKT
jgi:hypothetical protein